MHQHCVWTALARSKHCIHIFLLSLKDLLKKFTPKFKTYLNYQRNYFLSITRWNSSLKIKMVITNTLHNWTTGFYAHLINSNIQIYKLIYKIKKWRLTPIGYSLNVNCQHGVHIKLGTWNFCNTKLITNTIKKQYKINKKKIYPLWTLLPLNMRIQIDKCVYSNRQNNDRQRIT